MPAVTSSVILNIDYDPATRTLFIRFTDDDLYAYFGVPEREYRAFLDAESKGRYFAAHVRDRYAHHLVR